MALTIDVEPQQPISLDEYVEKISYDFNLSDETQVIASAPLLASLASNQSFIAEYINCELLESLNDFQSGNKYSAQTLTLAQGKNYSIRVNMWLPLSRGHADWETKLYAYGDPHDHNFSFLTIGYLGPGYKTEIYEYDCENVVGYVGEKVDMRYLEKTSLPMGKSMFYRASKDIHTQEPPTSFSMSLNLLVVQPAVKIANQYFFNTSNKTISGIVPNANTSRVTLANFARYVGNAQTVELLSYIAEKHPQPRLRWYAYESMSLLSPCDSSYILERAANDKSNFVKWHANAAIDARCK